MEFETQASKAAKGIMMIIPVDFKINFFEKVNYLSGRQIVRYFRLSTFTKLANYELDNVELHNDSLKMFNAWEETLLAIMI